MRTGYGACCAHIPNPVVCPGLAWAGRVLRADQMMVRVLDSKFVNLKNK